jgi:hypothetical protein
MTTEERLAKVERELGRAKRRSRWLVAVVGLAGVGLILIWTLTKTPPAAQPQEAAKAAKPSERLLTDEEFLGQEAANAPKPAQVIRATAFVLVDDEGRERGKLEMSKEGPGKDGPSLTLSDENGNIRVMLSMPPALDSEPSLVMYGGRAKSNYRVLLFGGGLFLRNTNDKLRVGLSSEASLELNDANGMPRAGLGVTAAGAELALGDENGKARAWLRVGKDGSPSLDLRDENGEIRARLIVDEYGPALDLYDAAGKTRAMLSMLKDVPVLKDERVLKVLKGGPALTLFDENLTKIWSAP